MDLRTLIEAALSRKTGNREFSLHFTEGGRDQPEWMAQIGNPAPVVYLGETEGEFRAVADTPEEAVALLIAMLPE